MCIRDRFREVLRKKGKTFWFASFFLDKDAARKASILYAFCRLVDDLADEGGKDDTENLNSLAGFFFCAGCQPNDREGSQFRALWAF